MVSSKYLEHNNIKMDDDTLYQVQKLKYLSSIFTEGGKNKESLIKRIKEVKVMLNNKKQLLVRIILVWK
jgi:hypothetical protein